MSACELAANTQGDAELWLNCIQQEYDVDLRLFRPTEESLTDYYQRVRLELWQSLTLLDIQTNAAIEGNSRNLNEKLLSVRQCLSVTKLLENTKQMFQEIFCASKQWNVRSFSSLQKKLENALQAFASMTVEGHQQKENYNKWEPFIKSLNLFTALTSKLSFASLSQLKNFEREFMKAKDHWDDSHEGLQAKLQALVDLFSSSAYSKRVFFIKKNQVTPPNIWKKLQAAVEKELQDSRQQALEVALANRDAYIRVMNDQKEADITLYQVGLADQERRVVAAQNHLNDLTTESAKYCKMIQTYLEEISKGGLSSLNEVLTRGHFVGPAYQVALVMQKIVPRFFLDFVRENPQAPLLTYYCALGYFQEKLENAVLDTDFQKFFSLMGINPESYLASDGVSYDRKAIYRGLPQVLLDMLCKEGILVAKSLQRNALIAQLRRTQQFDLISALDNPVVPIVVLPPIQTGVSKSFSQLILQEAAQTIGALTSRKEEEKS
ncbi:MAG: hypothetical protein A3D96_04055 [Chlamydiae bacterium RIFCSPHIGHO2_12_FULL_44_59]|nr:MAG: hypothetical protein A2796_04370 [Chlamydiae bacterium RIFCSPHIGHO2_01_FULL_44_39]OGN60108.1 MAG: hypothetical protein A3D96_04055 [Chlamydiae bacterium RIFCSPHIGHO2_12_FULL_44_59]OGN66265.1 MAG: hypothetical protein A2978_00005 [Chlamydiae bacterium RIFCSPLOWO2_01_FULL_44_52]OGN68913.1 MAG: hypothetical protein A3I67_03985 [Chlamydiae bacterium RIFCSPLOWO2_02_FULL_45_22]OGN70179.1 MAG: hypothetical protein A3F79_06220 [Chlamydiae bacterium RIFCSPLOWO2_12_FULL_45_20]